MNYLTSRCSAKGLWQQTLGAVRAGILDPSQAPSGASQDAGNVIGWFTTQRVVAQTFHFCKNIAFIFIVSPYIGFGAG